MEEIVSSLPVYNVLTNLIPGTVLATLLKLYVKGCDIFSFSDNVLILVVIFYFLGVVSARISSLLVEPLLMKLKIVKYESHKDYTNAELREQTEKLTQLSRMSIEYRNYLSVKSSRLLKSLQIERSLLSLYCKNQDKHSSHVRSTGQRYNKI